MKQRGRISSTLLCGTALSFAFAAQELGVRAGRGLSGRFGLAWAEPSLEALCWLFLLWLGVAVLRWFTSEQESGTWPRRSGWNREFGLGFAVGWGLALLTVLPLLLSGHLHSRFVPGVRGLRSAAIGLLTLAVVTLVEELVFRGYSLRRLSSGIGPAWATVLLSAVFAGAVAWNSGSLTAMLTTWLFGILLSVGYLRSHGLWISWGVHFAYRGMIAVILGLPIAGRTDFGALTDTFATGPVWLSGGDFGPDAAIFTIVAMVAGIVVLVRTTRWHVWEYTHPVIVPGGYEVSIPPPLAHAAMEQAAPPPLVQILASTPQNRSLFDDRSQYE